MPGSYSPFARRAYALPPARGYKPPTPSKGGGWWIPGSQLDLDFANNRAFNRSTGFNGSPNGILTYTSPSPKLVYGDDGVLGYAPHNLLLQSDNLLSTWTPTLATISSAELFLETASSGQHRVQQSFAALVGMEYGIKVKLKGEGRDWARVGLVGTGALVAFFNLTGGGAVGTISGGLAASITGPDSDGFFSCTVAGAIADNASSSIYVNGATSDTVTTYLGDVAKGVRVKNAHVYRAPNHSNTYIPTTSAAVYALPIDHNPTTFAPLGVLIEEQRTNLVTYSQAADNAAWSKVALLTVNGNNAGAPDGTATFCNLTPNTTNTQHYISTAAFTPAAGALCCSAYFKANGYRWVRFAHSTGIISFDTLTGTIGATSGITSSGVQSLGNGVYRAWFVYTASAVSTSLFISVNNADNTGTTSFAGDGTSGVFVWGVQAEAGAFPTSYIPTVASQVTRAADQVSILTSAFGYNATAGTVLVEGSMNGNGAGNAGWWALDAGAVQNGHSLRVAIGNNILAISRGASSNQTVVGLASAVAGTFYETAFAYSNENDRAISTEGAAVVEGTTAVGTINSATTLRFGFQQVTTTGGYLNGHIKRLTYFSTRKTDSELQALSA